MVGARFGHGRGKVGAWLLVRASKVGAQGRPGSKLGHGRGMVGA